MDEQQQMDEATMTKAIQKATAVREAMCEIVNENRTEIIRRARAKLTAMGVMVTDEESGVQL